MVKSIIHLVRQAGQLDKRRITAKGIFIMPKNVAIKISVKALTLEEAFKKILKKLDKMLK